MDQADRGSITDLEEAPHAGVSDTENARTSARPKKPTEKGLTFWRENRIDSLYEGFSKLDILSTRIKEDIEQGIGQSRIQLEYDEWKETYNDLIGTYDEYSEMFSHKDIGEKNTFVIEFNTTNSFKRFVDKWLIGEHSSEPHIRPEDSVSQSGRSHTSSHRSSAVGSSITSQKIKEKQRKAELITRASVLKQRQALELEKQELELQRLKLKMKVDELDLNTEIQITDARSKVLNDFESNLEACNLPPDSTVGRTPKTVIVNKPQHQRVKHQEMNSRADPFSPDTSRAHSHPNPNDIISVVRHLSKPTPDISRFSGDPMEYGRFILQFNTKVVRNCQDYEEIMNYLEQFTSGEARRIISGFSYLPAETGYKAAMDELQYRYGNEDVIANAFIRKAINWPPIKSDNPKALDDFSIFLVECENAVNSIEATKVLEYSENLKRLVGKLPSYFHDKWRNIVEEAKFKQTVVKFSQLVQFVRREARKSNDPTYGREAMKFDQVPGKQSISKKFDTYRPKATFLTKGTEIENKQDSCASDIKVKDTYNRTDNSVSQHNKPTAFTKPCLYCAFDSHCLNDCRKISSILHQDRIDFLRIKGLCFSCLTKGHQSKDCKSKATCDTCKKNHPTICHVDFKGKTAQSASAFVTAQNRPSSHMGAGEGVCRMAVIPVKVKMQNGSVMVDTYAFLDPGSSISFCTDSLIHQIGGSGKKLNIKLDTMGTPCSMDTYAVNGVETCDLQMKHCISLPKVYTKDKMPLSRHHIPTFKDVAAWPHLRDLQIPQITANIGILIGNNVPDVYTPLDIRTGPTGSPHATKSRLGWILWNVVIASQSGHSKPVGEKYTVNRASVIAIQESEQLKELDRLVRESINRDFPEKRIDDKREHSVEDKQFDKIVQESTTMVDGHYQIGLPIRQGPTQFPDNRLQALQRLKSLERKMIQNDQFKNDYTDFMSNVIGKGYAEFVEEDKVFRDDGKTWYLPHHGVYHPHKPNKIRVVFDCSATFEGVSLNTNLLQGPDLTNSLIGVLLRFRKEKIAIMGDIESMFYQVKVPPEDQDLQRFLWWPNLTETTYI